MGYRSDVALALTGNALKKLKKALSEIPEQTKQEIERLLTSDAKKHISNENNECWLWQEIKWYSGWPQYYPEIDFVDKILDEADPEDFYFVRCGEDYDDNEIRGLWWDNPFGISLCREVVLDC